jgi:hypothetical protein
MKILGYISIIFGMIICVISSVMEFAPDSQTDEVPASFGVGFAAVVVGIAYLKWSKPKK